MRYTGRRADLAEIAVRIDIIMHRCFINTHTHTHYRDRQIQRSNFITLCMSEIKMIKPLNKSSMSLTSIKGE